MSGEVKKGFGKTEEVRQRALADPEHAEEIIRSATDLSNSARTNLRKEFGLFLGRKGHSRRGNMNEVRKQAEADPEHQREIINSSDLSHTLKTRLKRELGVPLRPRRRS